MNFYTLNLLAPILFIICIFLHCTLANTLIATSIIIASWPFFHAIIKKLSIFLVLGMLKGALIYDENIVYSYKRTSSLAHVIDIKEKEHGTYLLLENFQFIPNTLKRKNPIANKTSKNINNEDYIIDSLPKFPKIAQMKIKDPSDVTKLKNSNAMGATIQIVGRFLLPAPSPIMQTHQQKIPMGLIDEIKIIKEGNHFFKNKLRKKFDSNLSKNSSQLAKAILLADTFAIDQNIRKIFQKAGTAHLLGVSVLNIAILSLIFFFLFRFLIAFFFYKIALIIPLNIIGQAGALLITSIYCYLVGFEYPLLRSLLMSSFAIVALYFGRNRQLEILLFSCAIILGINPDAIFDLGFQLSFGAVLGLCCINSPNISNKFLRWLINALLSTFFASLVLMPLSIFHFHSVNLQPFIANLIAIPFVSFVITPLSLIWILLALFTSSLEKLIAPLLDYAFKIFIAISEYTSYLSCNIHIDPISSYGIITFVISVALFAIFAKEKIKYLFLGIGITTFASSIYFKPKKPFLLIHPYAIGMILDDKIVVYPKCNFVSDIWQDAYQLKCINGRNTEYFQKEKCGKIIVNKIIGLIFIEPKSNCHIKTKKNYIIPYSEQFKKTQLIKL